jgi:hypothetical protein
MARGLVAATLLDRDEPQSDGFLWDVVWPRPKAPWPVRLRHPASGATAYAVYDRETDVLERIRPEEDESLPALGGLLSAGRLVAYRPGRRATVRLQWRGEARYAKIYRPGRADAPRKRLRAAAAALEGEVGAPALPELVEADLAAGVLVLRGAPGRSMHGRTTSGLPVPSSMLDVVARSLARLHEASGRSLPDGDAPIGLDEYARIASEAFPEEEGLLLAALQGVVALPPSAAPGARLVHGDLHDRNVLLDGTRVTLLDLDLARAGDPAEDVGNLAAHLFLRALQASRGLAGRADAERLLRSYYRADGSIDDPAARRFGARTLFRLACLYQFRRPWQHLTPTLAAEALHWAVEASRA